MSADAPHETTAPCCISAAAVQSSIEGWLKLPAKNVGKAAPSALLFTMCIMASLHVHPNHGLERTTNVEEPASG
jgi:hypothetical protein